MPDIVIIQGSLNKNSRTAVVVKEAEKILREKNISFETLDLRNLELQFCDGRSTDEYNKDMQDAYRLLESAKGFIIGMPVYQYTFSGVIKNLMDITAKAFENKFFGIICNSGGVRSYLASAELMKLLSFESHSIPIQPTIHTWRGDFDENGTLTNEEIPRRLNKLITTLITLIRNDKRDLE